MPDIQGILFDKDGTLLDFNRTWLLPYRRAAAYLHQRYGVAANPEALLAHGGFIAETQSWQPNSPLASGGSLEIIALWQDFIGELFGDAELAQLRGIFALGSESVAWAVDDVGEFLRHLRARNLRLGIATMDSEANARTLVQSAGVAAYFDFICGVDSGYGSKPEPGMVQAFCAACDLECAQVMMVGDSPWDLQMGVAAGVGLSVGVLSGAHAETELRADADAILPSIAQLPSLLQ